MQSCELHLHTDKSLLDGLNTPEEYLARAAEIGMTHMAVTDHGTPSSHRAFQKAAKAAGIIPILGLEAYYSATGRFDVRPVKKREDNTQLYNHITLLAMNENGLRNLNKMSEIAWTEGFYMKPRIDFELLEAYNEDIIMLTGCLNSPIIKTLFNEQDDKTIAWHRAITMTEEFQRIFGDRLFMEIQGHNPKEVNEGVLNLAWHLNIEPVVTSDCHFARAEDAWIEDALLIISTKPSKNKDADTADKVGMFEKMNHLYPDRTMTFEKFNLWLHSAAEQHDLLRAQGIDDRPIHNTMVVANMIGEYPFHEALDLLPTPQSNPDEILHDLVMSGLKDMGKDTDQVYLDRAFKEEIPVITSKGFSSYMLIVADAVAWAKSEGIMVGPGRGSAAGSLVCRALGITGVDPIPTNLLFFRFLDPSRDDYPDIDIDIEDTRRDEVKNYMIRKYKNVANIITYNTFAGKSSVKSAAAVFGIPYMTVEIALANAHSDTDEDFLESWLPTESGRNFAKRFPEVIELAQYLQGRIRGTGIHPGGLVVSKEPIANYAPIQTAQPPNNPAAPRTAVVALDMNEVADLGLIKIDFLGLKNLTVINNTLGLVRERHGVDIDLYDIDYEDAAVYRDISSGYTKGYFQAEAGPYTSLIGDMGGVHNFEELVASNALVRPGASNSSIAKDYINAKNTGKWSYIHPDVEYFTKTTYGLALYQEQQMLLCTELAGMTMQEANEVRRAIGKKKAEKLALWKDTFIAGCTKKIGESKAKKLWHDLEASAKYAFNRSHSYSYSMITYWTAWLKHYYPLEYMLSTLQHVDSESKVGYLMETKRLGQRIVLPHVNVSDARVSIKSDEEGDHIRIGLADVKYLSDTLASRLIDRRPFNTYADLYTAVKTKNSGLNSRMLDSLNKVGAAVFIDNPLRGDERTFLYEYLGIPSFGGQNLSEAVQKQLRPLDQYSDTDAFISLAMVSKIVKSGPGWTLLDILDDSGTASVFTDEHTDIQTGQLYIMLIGSNSIIRFMTPDELLEGNSIIKVYLNTRQFLDIPRSMLKVIGFKTRVTKNGGNMATVVFTDKDKNLTSATVFPQKFKEAFIKFQPGAVVDVVLKATDKGHAVNYIL